jgi:hypothetical protein
LAALLFNQENHPNGKVPVEPLPDLTTVSDDELSALIAQLEDDEDAISVRRRVLHGRIDILRGERTARLKAQVAAGTIDVPSPTSLERSIYAGTGEVPAEHDLEALPDLSTIDDDAIRTMIRGLEQEEDDISLGRRVLHAQIDIARAERTKRSRSDGAHIDAGDIGSILGGGQ